MLLSVWYTAKSLLSLCDSLKYKLFQCFGAKSCLEEAMLGKSDLLAARFLLSAWRHHAGNGSVSFGFTSVIAFDCWREAKRIGATFCLLELNRIPFRDLFKTRKIKEFLQRPTCLCLWESGEVSHGADGVKERMWVSRGATASQISMRKKQASFQKENSFPIYIFFTFFLIWCNTLLFIYAFHAVSWWIFDNLVELDLGPGESLMCSSTEILTNKFFSLTKHVPCVSTLVWFQRYLS